MTDIRPLTGTEPDHFAALLADIDPWRRLGYNALALADYLDRPDPTLSRMVMPGKGVIALRSPWLRGPYIELLAVLPEAQGQGIGRALVEWATSRGGANLWACVSEFNAPARAFYARLGFTEVAKLPGLVAPGETEILLRKSG
jgi:ribosomal protein S18 acetylase RimI-like enzyme